MKQVSTSQRHGMVRPPHPSWHLRSFTKGGNRQRRDGSICPVGFGTGLVTRRRTSDERVLSSQFSRAKKDAAWAIYLNLVLPLLIHREKLRLGRGFGGSIDQQVLLITT